MCFVLQGITMDILPSVLATGFQTTLTGISSWALIVSALIFSQAFAYLLLLIQSPIISLGVACLGFPIVGVWWSFFQIQYNLFTWMPILSGELVCAFLGFPLILGGCYYLFKLDVLKLDPKLTTVAARGSGSSQPSTV